MAGVLKWADISDEYQEALLVGNGASIAVDERFHYRNLLEEARTLHLITPTLQRVFGYLNTHDFEFVLKMLWHTYHINKALGIQSEIAEEAYDSIRRALIETIQQHHAPYDVVRPKLPLIWKYLKHFTTVLSLNYDLIVYWAFLDANDILGGWFKDGFAEPDHTLKSDWRVLRKPRGAEGATLVWYPHGNLALASSLDGTDRKITRRTANLLDDVSEAWRNAEATPLFVAEGESRQKELAIRRSGYLSTVFDEVLPELGTSLVIYGWGMKDNDKHILRQLCEGDLLRIAVSVRISGRSRRAVDEWCDLKKRQIASCKRQVEVQFFDAESSGCWIHT
jgi:hypothetical protein